MVKVDDKLHKFNEYRDKAYKVLDNFITEENEKGETLHRNTSNSKVPDYIVFSGPDCDFEDVVMSVQIWTWNLDAPALHVHKKEYFDKAKDVAEKIEKEIGVEVLLRELYY